jgi:hypothetical protein
LTETGHALLELGCVERAGAIPPESYHDILCWQGNPRRSVTVTLGNGVSVGASAAGGVCFSPRPAYREQAPANTIVVPVARCMQGAFAAAAVVKDHHVTLLIPRQGEARTLLLFGFLVLFAANPDTGLIRREPPRNGLL